MSNEIESKVIAMVARQAGVEPTQVTRDHHYINDLGLDSLDKVELAMQIEDVFNITMPDDQVDDVMTVGAAIDYVAEQMNKAEAGRA